jgi:hypothetical protein
LSCGRLCWAHAPQAAEPATGGQPFGVHSKWAFRHIARLVRFRTCSATLLQETPPPYSTLGVCRRLAEIGLGEEMTDQENPLAGLSLERAIYLRWVLRDIIGKRTKLSPVGSDDVRTLIEMGLVEMRDGTPVVTHAGDRALD